MQWEPMPPLENRVFIVTDDKCKTYQFDHINDSEAEDTKVGNINDGLNVYKMNITYCNMMCTMKQKSATIFYVIDHMALMSYHYFSSYSKNYIIMIFDCSGNATV